MVTFRDRLRQRKRAREEGQNRQTVPATTAHVLAMPQTEGPAKQVPERKTKSWETKHGGTVPDREEAAVFFHETWERDDVIISDGKLIIPVKTEQEDDETAVSPCCSLVFSEEKTSFVSLQITHKASDTTEHIHVGKWFPVTIVTDEGYTAQVKGDGEKTWIEIEQEPSKPMIKCLRKELITDQALVAKLEAGHAEPSEDGEPRTYWYDCAPLLEAKECKISQDHSIDITGERMRPPEHFWRRFRITNNDDETRIFTLEQGEQRTIEIDGFFRATVYNVSRGTWMVVEPLKT